MRLNLLRSQEYYIKSPRAVQTIKTFIFPDRVNQSFTAPQYKVASGKQISTKWESIHSLLLTANSHIWKKNQVSRFLCLFLKPI